MSKSQATDTSKGVRTYIMKQKNYKPFKELNQLKAAGEQNRNSTITISTVKHTKHHSHTIKRNNQTVCLPHNKYITQLQQIKSPKQNTRMKRQTSTGSPRKGET